jgi:hypothetical protein
LFLQAYPIDKEKFKRKEFNEIKEELSKIKRSKIKEY